MARKMLLAAAIVVAAGLAGAAVGATTAFVILPAVGMTL
jgi:hypothetical protein